jgi:hypothetical protein
MLDHLFSIEGDSVKTESPLFVSNRLLLLVFNLKIRINKQS